MWYARSDLGYGWPIAFRIDVSFVFRRSGVTLERSRLTTVSLPLILAASVFGQEPQIRPSPALPASVLGPQLIVWSHLQKPQPVSEPLPEQQQQPGHQQARQPANKQDRQQLSAQTFTGTIMKDGSKYVLKESRGATYQLDDNAKQYEGKQVKIVGSLDANDGTLRVSIIQLIS